MIQTKRITQPTFNLVSEWGCSMVYPLNRPDGYMAIVHGPTEAAYTVEFPVELPAAATVYQAYLTVRIAATPRTGAAYKRINGKAFADGDEIQVEGITPETASWSATYTMQANGAIEAKQGVYSGTMTISTPTLVIVYDDGTSEEPDAPGTPATRHTGSSRLPRLLDRNLREVERLACTRLSLDLLIDPLSTATMRTDYAARNVRVGDFVELFSPDGSVGIFRATRTSTTYAGTGGQNVDLEHGLVTLADDLAIGGNVLTGPVRQVFATLLEGQSVRYWVLGECEVPEDLEIVYEYRYETKLQAITGLVKKLPDGYALEYDQTVFPWELHIRQVSEADACEGRLSRNLEKTTVTIDRDPLCTRLYAFGAGEGDERITLTGLTGSLYLDADTQDEWGIVSKQITVEDAYDALTLRDVAERYLTRYKTPPVSVTTDAHDLYIVTGESFDRWQLGRMCRLALPEYGLTVRERVVRLHWDDVFGKPHKVGVTLANRLRTASDEIAELLREATNGKLIGGKVETETKTANNSSVTQSSSLVHYFDITGYGNTLSVLAEYTASSGYCRMNVDGVNDMPVEDAQTGRVDILRYLASDENGVPTVGQHFVQYFAAGAGTISVSSKLTIKTIEKG